ncbi:MAG: Rho termination factor N-terminal domain-containing protein [Alphaproteobacteria bacterium]|nr:Rho termination factor N-terminal domain-containing protein [Alphaproteobacteria bacterium]
MIHLRLTNGAGHSNGFVSVTREKPDAYVEDEAVAAFCVDSGFFEIIDDVHAPMQEQVAPDTPGSDKTPLGEDEHPGSAGVPGDIGELEGMTVAELRTYAESTGIDIDGATKKADIIEKIKAAEGAE